MAVSDQPSAVSRDSERELHRFQEHCRRETAPYKYPRLIEFTDELPKTASGKIRRAELRDSAAATDQETGET